MAADPFNHGKDLDVFVSYSRSINEAAERTDKYELWSGEFIDRFTAALRHLGGERIRVFDDRQMTKNQDFEATLERNARSCAVFLVILSRNYFEREWCNRELDWFLDSARNDGIGLTVGNDQRRLVKVLTQKLPHGFHVDRLGQTEGHQFHDAAPAAKDYHGHPVVLSGSEFEHRVRQLAEEVFDLLNVIPQAPDQRADAKGLLESTVTGPAPATPEVLCSDDDAQYDVFFADVAHDLEDDRTWIATRLHDKGFRIHKSVPPPYTDQHDHDYQRVLERCSTTVHMFSTGRGQPFGTSLTETYPTRQLQLATQRIVPDGKPSLPPVIYVPMTCEVSERELADTDPEDREYLGLVRSLKERKNPFAEDGARAGTFANNDRTRLLNDLHDMLRSLADQRAKAPIRVGPVSPTVIIDVHDCDRPDGYGLAADLHEIYQGEGDLKVNVVVTTGNDEREAEKYYRQCLASASGLFVFFGRASTEWVRARLQLFNTVYREGNLVHLKRSRVGVFALEQDMIPDDGFRDSDFYPLLTGPDRLGTIVQ